MRAAYGAGHDEKTLAFLLRLNQICATAETKGASVTGPGLPLGCGAGLLVTTDAVDIALV